MKDLSERLKETFRKLKVVDAEGYEKPYYVSEHGGIYRVFESNKLKPLKPYKTKNGYLEIKPKDGEHHFNSTKVHRIVAEAFCPNAKKKPYVHHIDGNRENNDSNNLLWCTAKEHVCLHQLLRAGQTEDYYNEVARILKDNKE